jgi:hypothetical protein
MALFCKNPAGGLAALGSFGRAPPESANRCVFCGLPRIGFVLHFSRELGAIPLASFCAFAAGTGAHCPACPLQK